MAEKGLKTIQLLMACKCKKNIESRNSAFKKLRLLQYFYIVLIGLCVASCGSVKYDQLVMYSDVNEEMILNDSIPTLAIKPDDILKIDVTSRNPTTVEAFKLGSSALGASGENAIGSQEGYRVNESGLIHLPFLGAIEAAGKGVSELRQEIQDSLKNYIQDAFVQIRFLSFRVTILGEVNLPNTYSIPNERLNLLEAIGMAGDMTAYANRNEVLLIRARDSQREFVRLNVKDKDFFLSPYFYLKPNDIIYVSPLKAKKYATSGDFLQRYAQIFIPFVTILTFFIGRSTN